MAGLGQDRERTGHQANGRLCRRQPGRGCDRSERDLFLIVHLRPLAGGGNGGEERRQCACAAIALRGWLRSGDGLRGRIKARIPSAYLACSLQPFEHRRAHKKTA